MNGQKKRLKLTAPYGIPVNVKGAYIEGEWFPVEYLDVTRQYVLIGTPMDSTTDKIQELNDLLRQKNIEIDALSAALKYKSDLIRDLVSAITDLQTKCL